jgi:hypothetical protein
MTFFGICRQARWYGASAGLLRLSPPGANSGSVGEIGVTPGGKMKGIL